MGRWWVYLGVVWERETGKAPPETSGVGATVNNERSPKGKGVLGQHFGMRSRHTASHRVIWFLLLLPTLEDKCY